MQKNKAGKTDSETLSEFVIQGMLEKKASDVVVLDLREIKHAVADYFIICSGSSDTQIEAISESIEAQVFKLSKEWPWKVEGKQNKEWVLIDYVNVVAHVFKKDRREFYGLEELWGDAVVSSVSA